MYFFIGAIELNLNSIPKPGKKASKCGLDQLPDLEDVKFLSSQTEEVSLFEQKRMYGWWPMVGEEGDERILAVNYTDGIHTYTVCLCNIIYIETLLITLSPPSFMNK